MKRLLRTSILALLLTLAACGQPVKSMFPPTITVQQLQVLKDGSWQLQVRILNNSYGGMDFQQVHLTMLIDDEAAATIEATPGLNIPALSPDIIEITVRPSAAAARALHAIADKGSAGSLGYTFKGTVVAIPQHADSTREFDVDSHDWLSAVPGIPHLFR